jgi:hypothetical protein
MSRTYEAGDLCVYCGKDTSFGSGRFVNRVVASVMAEDSALAEDAAMFGAEVVEGYACAECFEMPCDACGEPIALDEDYRADGGIFHLACMTREQIEQYAEEYAADEGERTDIINDYEEALA